jgi:hypothetical protein
MDDSRPFILLYVENRKLVPLDLHRRPSAHPHHDSTPTTPAIH